MRKIILLALYFVLCSLTLHVQSIGICTVKETKNALEYSFVFPKENIPKLHSSLKNYNDELKDLLMLQNLIHENIGISINDKTVPLVYNTTISEAKFITLKFKTTKDKKINSLNIKNKGLTFLNDHHTSFDFWLYLQNKKRLFKLNEDHNSINATY